MITTEDFSIPEDLARQVEGHLESFRPMEAWGILTAQGLPRMGEVAAEAYHPMREVHVSETGFPMEHESIKKIHKEIRDAGARIVAYVHSHPAGPPRLTLEESARARAFPTTHFLVVDLSRTPPKWGGGRIEAIGEDAPESFIAARVRAVAQPAGEPAPPRNTESA